MYASTIAVFKEILLNDIPHYIWYRAGEEGEEHLVPEATLTLDELMQRLEVG